MFNLKTSVSNMRTPTGNSTSCHWHQLMDLEVNWPPKKWKSANLVIIACIDVVYFVVGFMLHWIHCGADLRRFGELMSLRVAQTWRIVYISCWHDAFYKGNQNFIKILSKLNVVVQGTSKQAGWFLRSDCAPSSERPQFGMPPSFDRWTPPRRRFNHTERRAAAAVPLRESL